jgi:hypothetical protein
MDEDIRTIVLLDKTKPLRIVEPFYSTFSHALTPFIHFVEGNRLLQIASSIRNSEKQRYFTTKARVAVNFSHVGCATRVNLSEQDGLV